jgi:hypothetical protein
MNAHPLFLWTTGLSAVRGVAEPATLPVDAVEQWAALLTRVASIPKTQGRAGCAGDVAGWIDQPANLAIGASVGIEHVAVVDRHAQRHFCGDGSIGDADM